MPHQKLKTVTINTLGAFGYLFCTLQWLWAAVLFLPAILNSDYVKQLTQKPLAPTPAVTAPPAEMSTAGIIFVAVVAIVMILATIYICIKLPSAISKTGSKLAHKATDFALPIVTRHKELPQKKRLQLTARLLFMTKILLCIIPFGILLFVDTTNIDISSDIVIIIGAVTALGSLAFFCLQAASAKLLRVGYKQTW